MVSFIPVDVPEDEADKEALSAAGILFYVSEGRLYTYDFNLEEFKKEVSTGFPWPAVYRVKIDENSGPGWWRRHCYSDDFMRQFGNFPGLTNIVDFEVLETLDEILPYYGLNSRLESDPNLVNVYGKNPDNPVLIMGRQCMFRRECYEGRHPVSEEELKELLGHDPFTLGSQIASFFSRRQVEKVNYYMERESLRMNSAKVESPIN